MPKYQTVILIDIEAPSYGQALFETKKLATLAKSKYVPKNDCNIDNIHISPLFEYNDKGQRVLYLHPENSSLDNK